MQKRLPGAALLTLGFAVSFAIVANSAAAATCQNSGGFGAWLKDFRREATAQGINPAIVRAALSGIQYDKRVIARDRKQGVFSQSFLKFAGRMIATYRLQTGKKKISKYKSVFSQVQRKYGVPAPVIVAFWGLETDFGANMGDFNTFRSLASLAYDCRRPEKFRSQLLDALRIADRGDLQISKMVGAWAGELGHTQFLPTDYLESGVDFDGNGRVDLVASVSDAVASSASLLVKHGWRKNEPWLEEVKIPRRLPWKEADIAIQHPRSQWAKWGVKRASGKSLPRDSFKASLLLPMGKNGPAFLAYHNFQVYLIWNNSLVYSTTAAYFATRLNGAPRVNPGNAKVTPLDLRQIKQLQRHLVRLGYDVGKVDGIIGAATRASVKAVQIKLGLAADSYPTPSLLARVARM